MNHPVKVSEPVWKLVLAVLSFFATIQVAQAQADLTIHDAQVWPEKVGAGGSLMTSCEIYNLGNAAAASANIGYYLSADATFDADDVLIGASTSGELAAAGTGSSSRYRSFNLKVPDNTVPGAYYLLFVADYQDVVTESDETNNVGSVAVVVEVPVIDFQVLNPHVGGGRIVAGLHIPASAYIINSGNITSAGSDLGYYLSTDTIFDASDVLLGTKSGKAIAMGSTDYFSTYLQVPAGVAAGDYFILFVADYLNQIAEGDETNNTAWRPVAVEAPTIDLVLESPVLSKTTVVPGAKLRAEVRLRNKGNSAADRSSIGYFISTDTIFNAAEDGILGTSYVHTNSPGGTFQTHTYEVPIPQTIAPGHYYLLMMADYPNQVPEEDETNNMIYIAFEVEAPFVDLALESPLLGTTSMQAGNYVETEVIIRNLGNSPAAYSGLNFYLSTTTTHHAAAIPLGLTGSEYGSPSTGELSAGASGFRRFAVYIPINTPPGDYYILFVAGSPEIPETNLSNNMVYAPLTLLEPTFDLFLHSPTVSLLSVAAGTRLKAGAKITNEDNAPATYRTFSYFLSANDTFDSSDRLINQRSGAAVAANSVSELINLISIPANTPPGQYHLFMVADNEIVYNEEYNTRRITSTPLTITEQVPPFLMPRFQYETTSYTTCSGTLYDSGGENNYPGQTDGTLTLYPGIAGNKIRLNFSFMELNTTYDVLSIYDGTSVSAPLIGQYRSSESPGMVTATSSSGALTLRFVTGTYSYKPGFEAAITCVETVTLPDLVVRQPTTFTDTLTAGNTLQVYYQLYNRGEAPALLSPVGHYLSADTLFDAGDLFLGATNGMAIATGAASGRTTSVTLPETLATGTYYLLLVADPAKVVTEANETNNVTAVPLLLEAYDVDLHMQMASASADMLTAGSVVDVSALVKNEGASAAPAYAVRYYLSVNSTLDSADRLLGSTSGSILRSGASDKHIIRLELPENLTTGNYHLLLVADHENAVKEKAKDNNSQSIPIRITADAFVDLIVPAIYISSTNLRAGASASATVNIRNLGNTAAPRSALGIYLSADTVVSADDLFIKSSMVHQSIAAGSSFSFPEFFTIPPQAVPGAYYLLIQADYDNQVAESDDTNNVAYLPFTVLEPVVDLLVLGANLSSTSVAAGRAVKATSIVYNQGSETAVANKMGYYLSRDNVLDAGDVLLRSSAVNALAAGAIAQLGDSLVVPANTAAGNYYVLFVADHTFAVAETTKENNVVAMPLTVLPLPRPDLVATTIEINRTYVVAGDSIYGAAYIRNAGQATAAAFTVNFYLSTKNHLDNTATLMAQSRSTVPLEVGWHPGYYLLFVLPAQLAEGTYYLLVQADADEELPESDETNNVSSIALTVTPRMMDLVIEWPVAAAAVAAGESFAFNTGVKNNGNFNLASFHVKLFLSANTTLDEHDIPLGSIAAGPLRAGYITSLSATFTVPPNTPSGNYQLLVVADTAARQTDFSNLKNVQAKAMVVSTTTALEKDVHSNNLTVWPSPATDFIHILALGFGKGEKSAELSLFNAVGEKLLTRRVGMGNGDWETALQVQHLPAGMYQLHIRAGAAVTVKKIIIQR